jgi:hypothetical protein
MKTYVQPLTMTGPHNLDYFRCDICLEAEETAEH